MSEGTSDRRILIIRTDRIGDVLLTTPAIKAVRDHYPNSHIAVMVRPYAEEIVDGNPYLDEVILYDKDGEHKGWWGTLKFVGELRRKKFDMALILHPTNRSNLIPFLAGIPERIGYDKKLGFLLTKKLKDVKHLGEKHEIDYNLEVLRTVGIEAKDKILYMPIKEENEKVIDRFFVLNNLKESNGVVAFHPGASCPSKRWSAYRFGRVADELMKKYKFNVVIIGGPSDVETVKQMHMAMLYTPIILSEEHSLGEVAALLKRCKIFISNDSGPVHIAVAVGTPVISIFGRADPGLSPKRWAPVGPNDVVIHKDVGCRECFAHNCKINFKCLEAITVDDVLNAAENLVKKI